jgi:hypothetical protein
MAFDSSQELLWAGNEYVRPPVEPRSGAHVRVGQSLFILWCRAAEIYLLQGARLRRRSYQANLDPRQRRNCPWVTECSYGNEARRASLAHNVRTASSC